MIQTIISNAKNPEYGQATISFPIKENDYLNVVELLRSMGLGNPLERDCRVDEVCGDWPILKRLEKVAINLDEMDYLARRLDSFDMQEKAKFQAAAVRFGLFDMRQLIDLTFCCQETTVITDFSDLEKIGRRHFLDVNGGSASSEELKNVDGYETALLLIGEGDGTITPYGVIYDNGMQLRPVYDGQHFPFYLGQDCAMIVGVTDADKSIQDIDTTWLYLPTSKAQINRALVRANLHGETMKLHIESSDCPSEVTALLNEGNESLEEVNELAAAIFPLSDFGKAKLSAVIRMVNPGAVKEVTVLAQNLDEFRFIPCVRNAEEYGRYLICGRKESSPDPGLDQFIDYEAYGQYRAARECGQFSDYGYVSYLGELSLSKLMAKIPGHQPELRSKLQMGGM